MSVEELGDTLGLDADRVQAFEAGGRIDASVLFAIAKILNNPIGFFFDGLSDRR